MAKTNAQIRAAQIKKANVFIKRAFHNEEIKPQAMDVTDNGTHLNVYVLGNKKFNGHMSDYELSFNITKGIITDLGYSSPSISINESLTQEISVGKRNQVETFGKSVDASANAMFSMIEDISETAAQVSKFNGFMHNVLLTLEEAAADGEFDFAPANDEVPTATKQAVANSRAKVVKAVKSSIKKASTKLEKKESKPAKKVAPKAEKKALAAAKKDVLKKLADKTKKVAKAKAAKPADKKAPAKTKKAVTVKKAMAKKAVKKAIVVKKTKK